MIYRSILFAPGDSERKIEKALATSADVIVLDLEDSVTPENRSVARELVRRTLTRYCGDYPGRLWVRVNPVATNDCLTDLAAVVTKGLSGIMLPKPDSASDIEHVGHYLSALETKANLEPGAVKILSVMTETARAFLNAHSYGPGATARGDNPRLAGLLWGAEDLSAALGASANTDACGELSFTYKMARSMCLAAAAAAECQPIDTVYTDFHNTEGLKENCLAARREGFLGKVAIHPNQVDVINAAFTPSDDEVSHARAVIRAFNDNPGKGTVGLEGKMLDRPHYIQAQRLMAMARHFSQE